MPVTIPAYLYRPLRVFLLDDHEIVRRGLEDLLEHKRDITVVGQGGSAQQAIPQIIRLRPDVMVLDVHLRDGSGLAVCLEVRAEQPSVKGLLLTSDDDDEALLSAVVAGAHGYVLKELSTLSLVEAIRRVGAGERILDRSRDRRLRERLETLRHAKGRLETREREMLGRLLDGLGRAEEGWIGETGGGPTAAEVASLVPRLIHELRRRGRKPHV